MPAWNVALLQVPGRGGTVPERIELARGLWRGLRADLTVLPEAWLPGYAHGAGEAEAAARAAVEDAPGVVVAGFLGRGGCCAGVAFDGRWTVYRKQFPSPDERRHWQAGAEPGIVDTPVGRLGLLVCADVLQRAAWEALRGRVDLVAIPAAWPDYAGRRGFGAWLRTRSGPYRDDLLARAAASLGVPVIFVNATGPWRAQEGFDGGSAAWDHDGQRVAGPAVGVGRTLARVSAGRGTGAPLEHPPAWRALEAAWRIGRR